MRNTLRNKARSNEKWGFSTEKLPFLRQDKKKKSSPNKPNKLEKKENYTRYSQFCYGSF